MPTPAPTPNPLRAPIVAAALCLAAAGASANDAQRAIEQALADAMAGKRGITLHVNGQTIGGAVTRIEAGQWVELRGPQSSRIVVRIDRIDAVVQP